MGRVKWSAGQQRAMVLENFDLFEKFDNGNEYFVGFDFSLTSVGICVVDNQQRLLYSEAIETAAKDGTTRERLQYIGDRMEAVIREYPPRILAWEAVTVSTNISSMMDLCRVGGMLYEIMTSAAEADDYEIPYCVLANVSTLKKVATGGSEAKKSHVLMEVFDRWGHKFTTDDEADAFGAAVVASRIPVVAEMFKHWRKWYEEESDYRFLLDLLKMRYDDIVEDAEKEGIPQYELEAILNLFTGSRGGGSGLKQLSENDKDFYYEARARLKEL
jgi:Holliday junction resolvasome RuvABC endonuclease subunit